MLSASHRLDAHAHVHQGCQGAIEPPRVFAGRQRETKQHKCGFDALTGDMLRQPTNSNQFDAAVGDVVGTIARQSQPMLHQCLPVLHQEADIKVRCIAKNTGTFVHLEHPTMPGFRGSPLLH